MFYKLILIIIISLFTTLAHAILDGQDVSSRETSVEKSTIALQMKYINTNGKVTYRKGTAFIINKDTLLTAGHNVFYIEEAKNIEAIFSVKPCWGINICGETRASIIKKTVHPGFENDFPNPPVNDIAILKLSRPIPDGYLLLSLPENVLIKSRELMFLGYGNSVASPTLDNFRLRKIKWKASNLTVGQKQKFIFSQSFGGFCAGDSGGALITEGLSGKHIAVGIAIHHSLEVKDGREGCFKDGTYTDIKFFINWINDNLT